MTMQLMMEVAPMQRVPPCEQSKEAIRQIFVSGVEEANLKSESIRLAAASGLSSGGWSGRAGSVLSLWRFCRKRLVTLLRARPSSLSLYFSSVYYRKITRECYADF